MDHPLTFTPERLDAFVVVRDLVAAIAPLVRRLPRGEAAIGDQLRRAGDSVLLNTCEGAGRRAGADKAHYFDMARGSATECGGALTIFAARQLAPTDAIATARSLAHRAACLLTALARSARKRSGTG